MSDAMEQLCHPAALPAYCERALQHILNWRDRASAAEKNRRMSDRTFDELFAGGWLDLLRQSIGGLGAWSDDSPLADPRAPRP